MKDRIIAYLAQGFPPQQVQSLVGCSAAYVSQVQAESTVQIAEQSKKYAHQKEEEDIEQGYVKLETKVQKAMEANLPFAEFADLTRAMGLLIQRRQRPVVPAGIVHDNRMQFVVLSVPQAAVPEFTLNEKKEVIAVGNKALAPLSAPAVRALFEKLSATPVSVERLSANDIEDADVILEKIPDDF